VSGCLAACVQVAAEQLPWSSSMVSDEVDELLQLPLQWAQLCGRAPRATRRHG
jgi:hypothetical protein